MKHARPDYNRIQDPAGLIPEDEPVFLIRGQDLAAPAALRFYAMTAHQNGAAMDVIEATLKQADEMLRWQRERARKTPDMPASGPWNDKARREGFANTIDWIREYRYRAQVPLREAKIAYDNDKPMPAKMAT